MVNPNSLTRNRRVQTYLAAAMGIPGPRVIKGKDAGNPAPNELYATYIILADRELGVDNIRTTAKGDGTLMDHSIRGEREVTYSVQTYREGAEDAIRRLQNFHLRPDGERALFQNSLFFNEIGDIREIGSIISGEWEERFATEIIFTVVTTDTDEINSIGSVGITINESAETDITETLEVQ